MGGKQKKVEYEAEHFPEIREEALEELRKRIGIKIERTVEPWVRTASEDAIKHFAWGIGDDNPLWLDPEYARRTRYGTIIAPPTFLYATNRVIGGYVGGLPGIHAMFAGTDWTWYKPTRAGDRIDVEVFLKELVEHKTRFAGRAIQQIYHGDFFNQTGDKIAEADSWCFRTERKTAREKGKKYKHVGERRRYRSEEIRKIAELYEKEEVRGATPRFWEEVAVGEPLPRIAKGPMTVTGFIAFVQGWGGLYIRAHKIAFKMFQKHKGLAIPNACGIPDVPERVHWEDDLAEAIGVPAAYDYGPERLSWMSHLMTNWIGDEGWLYRLNGKVVRHNPVGDVLTLSGTVKEKFIEGDKGCVRCALEARNQDGELSCVAEAVAILPLKNQQV